MNWLIEKLNKLFNDSKGQLDQFQPLVVSIVGIAFVLSVGFLILSNVGANAQVAAEPNATIAILTLTGALADIPAWVPIVVIVVIGVLLIGLVNFFSRRT